MLFYIITSVLISTVIYLVILYKESANRLSDLKKYFPSPPSKPVLGNLFLFAGKTPPEIFKLLVSFHFDYGLNIITIGWFNFFTLNITKPKDVETVLLSKTTQNKAKYYDFFRPWLGNGLLTANGREWFGQRKIITPAFHFNILNDFIAVFNKRIDQMMGILSKYDGQDIECDIHEYITLCAMDIICDTSMGLDINAQQNPNSEYLRAVKQTSIYIFERLTSAFSQYHWLYPYTPTARKQKKELKTLHDFATSVIIKRKEQLEKEVTQLNGPQTDNDENVPKKRMSFLDILLNSTIDGRPLTNLEIREQVDTFMFAGHDTTTSAIGFAIYHLSQNQVLQRKVYNEIVSVLGSSQSNVVINHASLQELKYLEMVIKETLRMYPSVPIIGRNLAEDTEIDGAMVPKGTDVNIFVYAVHHNPDVFPNPEQFDPERFMDGYDLRKNPYEYIPFSAGQRNCVGQKFAMLEMKIMLAKMLLNYVVLPSAVKKMKLEVRADLVMRPVGGISIKLVSRIKE